MKIFSKIRANLLRFLFYAGYAIFQSFFLAVYTYGNSRLSSVFGVLLYSFFLLLAFLVAIYIGYTDGKFYSFQEARIKEFKQGLETGIVVSRQLAEQIKSTLGKKADDLLPRD